VEEIQERCISEEMKFICEDNLNVVLELPFDEQIVLGEISFEMLTINTIERIPFLYMKQVGFKPVVSKGYTDTYQINHANSNQVTIQRCQLNNGSGLCENQVDVTEEALIKPEILLDGYKFLAPQFIDNRVMVKKYEIKFIKDDEFKIERIDELFIYMENKNLVIKRGVDTLSLEEFKETLIDVFGGVTTIVSMIIPMIYDSYVGEKGFLDIHKEFKQFMCRTPYLTDVELFEYYYYIGQLDLFYMMEYLMKNNLMTKFKECHPLYSGKPIPKPSDIKVLSKFGREFKEKHYLSDDEVLLEIEGNPKFGVAGLKVVDEYLEAMKEIECDYRNPLSLGWVETLLAGLNKVINTFNITPKVLMNRLVKVIFTECTNMFDYVRLIEDTVEMAQMLNIDLGDKLPKDIDRIHDLLSEQIKYVENLALEKDFNEQVILNESLLKILPKSDKFMVINPCTPTDLGEEGLKLNHCVGSYIKRYSTGYSKIFFIRTVLMPNEPFVTVELNQYNELVQAKGKSNKTPSKEVMDYIFKWVETLKNEMVEA